VYTKGRSSREAKQWNGRQEKIRHQARRKGRARRSNALHIMEEEAWRVGDSMRDGRDSNVRRGV